MSSDIRPLRPSDVAANVVLTYPSAHIIEFTALDACDERAPIEGLPLNYSKESLGFNVFYQYRN